MVDYGVGEKETAPTVSHKSFEALKDFEYTEEGGEDLNAILS